MINAKIIADSISNENRITTWELEYPRFIHAELMTHRVFSRNAASSRAIPIAKMLEMAATAPAMPEVWGINRPGMQATGVHEYAWACELQWKRAAQAAVKQASELESMDLHKQIVNRILEPFTHIKVVVTATEFDNWFWLRNHEAAQPEIRILADKMWGLYNGGGTIMALAPGNWHVPYFDSGVFDKNWECLATSSLEEAIKISASCCAQVSYRVNDDSIEKALRIYDQLVGMSPVHASPFEHQATPMKEKGAWDDPYRVTALSPVEWEQGVTHMDREANFWSGNFKGWIQNRQLIDGHVCNDYKGAE